MVLPPQEGQNSCNCRRSSARCEPIINIVTRRLPAVVLPLILTHSFWWVDRGQPSEIFEFFLRHCWHRSARGPKNRAWMSRFARWSVGVSTLCPCETCPCCQI